MGGSSQVYQWPSIENGIFIDAKDNVWLGGNGDKDAPDLKFTAQRRVLVQFGHRRPGASCGSFIREWGAYRATLPPPKP